MKISKETKSQLIKYAAIAVGVLVVINYIKKLNPFAAVEQDKSDVLSLQGSTKGWDIMYWDSPDAHSYLVGLGRDKINSISAIVDSLFNLLQTVNMSNDQVDSVYNLLQTRVGSQAELSWLSHAYWVTTMPQETLADAITGVNKLGYGVGWNNAKSIFEWASKLPDTL